MSIKKSSIQQAILEAREIEQFATEKAKKAIEEEMAPKIRQVANEALKEFENKSINEGMNLEIPDGAELTIKMPEDGTVENTEIEIPAEEIKDTTIETPADNTAHEEITNNEEDMSDIFEIEGLSEADDAVQPESGATAEIPAQSADATANSADVTPLSADEPASLESVNQKLDDVLAKLDSISNDETQSNTEGEGDVSIIEDEPEVPTETPAPALAENPAPVQEYALDEDENMEEVVYEVEDDNADDDMVEYQLEEDEDPSDLNIESVMEIVNELENIDEIELVDENNMEENAVAMEEDSQMKRHGVGQRQKIGKVSLGKHAPHSDVALTESINKIKAQYVSKVDELNQENASLKQTIKEYKDSFIVLRKQINEVQIFNAKLAYANKLFTNGGLTNDEKMKIAEKFDGVETIEEAKKLYNNLLSEMKVSKSPKTTSVLKSVNPAVIQPSSTQTLFESDEMKRMKRLAGI